MEKFILLTNEEIERIRSGREVIVEFPPYGELHITSNASYKEKIIRNPGQKKKTIPDSWLRNVRKDFEEVL